MANIKNLVYGPSTLSLGGADLGAIKKGSLEWSVEKDDVKIGDNEAYAGTVAIYRRIKRMLFKCVLAEASLANIRASMGLTSAVGGTNPQTLAVEFESGMLSTVTQLIVICAAPRTATGVAQTRTITATSALPTGNWSYKMGLQDNEIAVEFDVLYVDGTGDLVISDVNA